MDNSKELILDLDGVLINTMELWTKCYVEKWPDRPIPRPIDITDWNLTKSFQFSKQEMYDVFDEVRMNKSFRYASAMDSNFHIWLKKIQDELGYSLKLITANPSKCEEHVRYFLGKYGLGDLPIIFTKSSSEKLTLPWSIIVDDSADLANELPSDRIQLLYTNPWNATYEERKNVRRVYNFKDVYEYLKEQCQYV